MLHADMGADACTVLCSTGTSWHAGCYEAAFEDKNEHVRKTFTELRSMPWHQGSNAAAVQRVVATVCVLELPGHETQPNGLRHVYLIA
jgi:hypothetical protein